MAIYHLRLADQEPFCPPSRFPISPSHGMGDGAGHERAAGWLHMRVPDSCELETTADLQIPEQILSLSSDGHCVVFLFSCPPLEI